MIRLLCFLPGLEGGGAERTMVNLVNGLPAHGFDVRLATGRADGPAAAWLADPGVLMDLRAPRARQAVLPLRRIIADWRPDVLLSTMVEGNIMAVAATRWLRRRPAVVVRETNSHAARDDLSAGVRHAAGWAYRHSDRLIALSSGVGIEMVETYGLAPQRVSVVPNPVDVDHLGAVAAAAPAAPWPADGRPVVIGVGRLTRQKGFDLLIEAVARLNSRPRLVLLGEGPDRGALIAQAAARGVDLLAPGFVAEPAAWVARADVFALSSRWEGFGHVIVEAMAAGTPVVATDCPHGPRDILRDGETGVLVPPGDPAALADALGALLADAGRLKALATAAQSDSRRFSLEAVVARYAEVLREARP